MLTVICWSVAYVFTRLALGHFSIYSLGFLRFFLASVILALYAAVRKIGPPVLKDWSKFIASGATGFFIYQIVFNKGAMTETAATGSVLVATAPVITALLSSFLYGEKLKMLQWVAIAVEFSGILILTLMNGVFSIGEGIPWLLLAALLLGVFNLQQRSLTKTYSGLRTSIYSIFAGTLLLCLFAPESARQVVTAPPIHLFYVASLGIFSSAIAYVTWAVAFEKAPAAASVSNYMFLTPLFAATLGFFIAGERPDAATVVGGAVILSGILLFNLAGRRHSH
jgi:drug/metabolite transporter (DMT)-like permease